ncbi:MAG TPA: hypothetical protein VG826_36235 [Pirellulales bacterium]|nr:hypothetical protein [Pirellulales bacterium]
MVWLAGSQSTKTSHQARPPYHPQWSLRLGDFPDNRRLDQIPERFNPVRINCLRAGGNEANYWSEEAERVWERSAEGAPATRLVRTREAVAQHLENDVVDSAPEHAGDVYGHLLADAIVRVDWEAAAGALLSQVAARVAA